MHPCTAFSAHISHSAAAGVQYAWLRTSEKGGRGRRHPTGGSRNVPCCPDFIVSRPHAWRGAGVSSAKHGSIGRRHRVSVY
eukprot:5676803-Prymnesium_polylepis.1